MLINLDKNLLVHALNATEIKGFSDNFCWASNFQEIEPFEYEGLTYHTVENFYQAMKSIDLNERSLISGFTPGKSKRYTKKKSFILRENWDLIKEDIMRQALVIKFNQIDMKELLLATRDIYIEETNTWDDVFWGKNLEGEGLNKLGILLMEIRQELMLTNHRKHSLK